MTVDDKVEFIGNFLILFKSYDLINYKLHFKARSMAPADEPSNASDCPSSLSLRWF